MTLIRNIPIVDTWFRVVLAMIGSGLLILSFVLFRRWYFKWTARFLTLVMAVAFVGASINAHYGYFPTLGALLGRRAADQISFSGFRRLEQKFARTFTLQHGEHGSLPSSGVVMSFTMPPNASHYAARTGQIYLPPIWFEHPHPHLPVIELLHGSPGSPADWTRASFADLTADAYARQHNGFAPILVMPDVNGGAWWKDSECVDGVQGNAETYLIDDVRAAVVQNFGARADGGGWAVAGLSEGGSCALQMGLRHPESFAIIGDFSGADHPYHSGGLGHLFFGTTHAQWVRAERQYDPRWLLSHWHQRHHPRIVFGIGRSDSNLTGMMHLLDLARTNRIPAQMIILPGGHEFRLWGATFADALPALVRAIDRGDSRVVKPPVGGVFVHGEAAGRTHKRPQVVEAISGGRADGVIPVGDAYHAAMP
jgi:S-formylglutathione hydrolase FrmB